MLPNVLQKATLPSAENPRHCIAVTMANGPGPLFRPHYPSSWECWLLMAHRHTPSRSCPWSKRSTAAQLCLLPRGSPHPVTGRCRGTKAWLSFHQAGQPKNAITAADLAVGPARPLLQLYDSLASPCTQFGLPHFSVCATAKCILHLNICMQISI